MNEAEKKEAAEKLEKIREVVKQRNTARIALFEEIADKSESEQVAPDEAEAKEQIAAKEDEESERYARALQEEGIESAEPIQDSDEKTVNGEKYYRQIVNGREVWQTLKDIRQTAQKVASADDYLRTASEGARKAAELALSQRDVPSSLDEDETQRLLAAAVLGDEEATKKLASAIARLSRQPDISQAIDQRVSFRTELSRLEEKSEDLLKDPYMGRLFRDRINELKEQNPTMRINEAYTSIDAELRSAFPGFKGSRLQEKIERKRTLPIPPNAATRAGTAVEEEEPEDVSRDIAEMAKARGKVPYVHGPQRRS